MSEDREITAGELAKEMLIILVLDLQYSNELPARYGHTPMRHSGPWYSIERLIGKDAMFEEVARLEKVAVEGNLPCKTNPRLSPEARELQQFSLLVDGKIPTLQWRLWEVCKILKRAVKMVASHEFRRELEAMIEKHWPKDYWRDKYED